MKKCERCSEWLVYERHDCYAALRRKLLAEEKSALKIAELRASMDRESKNRRFRVKVAVAFVAIVGLATWFFWQTSSPEGTEDAVTAESSTAADYRSVQTSETRPSTSREVLRPYETVLEQLHDEAAATGYSGAVGQRMSPQIFEGFVGGMLSVCEDVESGYTTWAEETSRDIATGAPAESAFRFNSYLEDEFCPEAMKYN